MFLKRIIVCLDVKDGRTTKGVFFQNNKDVGDPVLMAKTYYDEGADELVFYDITASIDKRKIMYDTLTRVAKNIFIPFSAGGGIASRDDARNVLLSGAEKVSVNSHAVENPEIINILSGQFGDQCVVVGMDVASDKRMPSGYRVYTQGGRRSHDLDALVWAREVQKRGAGEIVLNSIDRDGTKEGYDLLVTRMMNEAVSIPLVASGGAGNPEHLREVLSEGGADAALIASMVHYGEYSIREIKKHLDEHGIPVRIV